MAFSQWFYACRLNAAKAITRIPFRTAEAFLDERGPLAPAADGYVYLVTFDVESRNRRPLRIVAERCTQHKVARNDLWDAAHRTAVERAQRACALETLISASTPTDADAPQNHAALGTWVPTCDEIAAVLVDLKRRGMKDCSARSPELARKRVLDADLGYLADFAERVPGSPPPPRGAFRPLINAAHRLSATLETGVKIKFYTYNIGVKVGDAEGLSPPRGGFRPLSNAAHRLSDAFDTGVKITFDSQITGVEVGFAKDALPRMMLQRMITLDAAGKKRMS